MQSCGDQRIEFLERGGGGNRPGIQHPGEARGLAQGLGLEGGEKARGVDAAVEAEVQRVAGRGQVERRGDAGGAFDQRARRRALFAQPFQQRVAAEGNADGENGRVGMAGFDVAQHAVDVRAVAGEIGARQPVVLARAAAEVRHHAMPAACPHLGHEGARIGTVGAAFQSMEQHHHRGIRLHTHFSA